MLHLAEADPPRPATRVADGGDVDPATGRLLSVAQLQRALRAARVEHLHSTPPTSPHVGASLAPQPAAQLTTRPPAFAWAFSERGATSVIVLAAHPGSGASTVALAIAEAAGASRRVRIVECADGTRSGLAAASTEELGVDAAGWRHGRRGEVEVHRLAHRAVTLAGVPAPAAAVDGEFEAGALLVLDMGWPVRDVLEAGGWVRAALALAAPVVVCRVTVPGVHHAEQVLAALGRPAVVAAVGPNRWPPVVTGSCGPVLRQARHDGRVVTVPTDRRLEAAGVSTDALPKPIAAAAKAIAALLAKTWPANRAGHTEQENTHAG
jgi:rhodanese-related sulfurtransferase